MGGRDPTAYDKAILLPPSEGEVATSARGNEALAEARRVTAEDAATRANTRVEAPRETGGTDTAATGT